MPSETCLNQSSPEPGALVTGRATTGAAAAMTDTGRSRQVLAATILASSLSFIDGSVVNVGLPALARAFPGDTAGLPWVIDGYLLPLSALLLFGGALGDRFGRGRVLAAGIWLFALASAACAVAPSLPLLILGRVLQGTGAALLMPNSLAVLGAAFSGEERGRAIGTWAAVGAATSGAGPLVGGWLIDAVGWRTIFAVNLPVAAAALILARRAIPRDGTRSDRPLDALGALLATCGLGALTFGLIDGSGRGGWGSAAAAGIGSGGALLALFGLWEHRRGPRAMVPLALFASRSFLGLTLLTLLLYGALGVLVVLLPYGLMQVGGTSALAAGAALVPVTACLALLSRRFGGLAARFGDRPLLVAGPAIIAIGFLLLARLDAASNYWTALLPGIVAIGLGLALAVAPLTAAVLAAVAPGLTGTASGLNSAVARTGGLVATACLGGALEARGEALVAAGHGAALAAALAALLAAGFGLMTGRRPPPA